MPEPLAAIDDDSSTSRRCQKRIATLPPTFSAVDPLSVRRRPLCRRSISPTYGHWEGASTPLTVAHTPLPK